MGVGSSLETLSRSASLACTTLLFRGVVFLSFHECPRFEPVGCTRHE